MNRFVAIFLIALVLGTQARVHRSLTTLKDQQRHALRKRLYHTAIADESVTAYIVVIDAGSTSSKFHMFKTDGSGIEKVVPSGDKGADPGFSQFVSGTCKDSPNKKCTSCGWTLESTLQQYTAKVASFISTNAKLTTKPIKTYIYATAGMRFAEAGNEAQAGTGNVIGSGKTYETASAFYTAVCGWAKGTFTGTWTCEGMTIPGKWEAKYAYLAAQALGNPESGSLALVEVGGASVQVAYEVASTATLTTTDTENGIESLNGKPTYIKSVNGIGGNSISSTLLGTDATKQKKCNYVNSATEAKLASCADAIKTALTTSFTGAPARSTDSKGAVTIGGGIVKTGAKLKKATIADLLAIADTDEGLCKTTTATRANEWDKTPCVIASMFKVLIDLGLTSGDAKILFDNLFSGGTVEVGMPYGVAVEKATA